MSQELAVRAPQTVTLSNDQLRYIASTEFVPQGLRGNVPAIMACVTTGRALGIDDMSSLRLIHVVNGRPTFSAELMTQLVRRAGHSVTGSFGDGSCTVKGKRADNGDEMEVTWTLEMARRAGLASKQTWKAYPEALLWARAVSQLSRMLFADVFAGGTYTPEELGDDAMDAEVVEDSGLEPSGTALPAPPAADAQVSEAAVSASSPDVRPGAATPEAADAPTTASAAEPPHDPTEPADLALLQHADRLEAKLIEHSTALAVDLGLVRDAVAGKRDEHAGEPELLVAWLGQQVGRAEAALRARAEKPTPEEFDEESVLVDPVEAVMSGGSAQFVAPSGPRGNVTAGQLKILQAAKEAGLTDEERHRITFEVAGCESSKDVPRGKVDAVVAALRGAGVQA